MNSDVELVRTVTGQVAAHLQDWHLVDDDPDASIRGMRLRLVHDDDPAARISVKPTSTRNIHLSWVNRLSALASVSGWCRAGPGGRR